MQPFYKKKKYSVLHQKEEKVIINLCSIRSDPNRKRFQIKWANEQYSNISKLKLKKVTTCNSWTRSKITNNNCWSRLERKDVAFLMAHRKLQSTN